jgi:cystathionine beta-synthase
VSQIPVLQGDEPIGSIREDRLLDILLHTPNVDGMVVDEVMGEPLPIVEADVGLDKIFPLLTRTPGTPGGHPAVLVRMFPGRLDIITKYDLVQVLQR